MSGKQFVIARNQLALVILLTSVFCFGACNRGSSQGLRLASTSEPGVNNAPINNGAPGSAAPVGSYADVVSRVSPAVITIHSEMRVRAAQPYPLMDDPIFRPIFGDRVAQQMP